MISAPAPAAGTPSVAAQVVVHAASDLGEVPIAPGRLISIYTNPTQLNVQVPYGVSYAGLTPGDPGLYQINAEVPSGIVTGAAVPVVISVAGQTSPPVTIAMQ